MSLKKILFENKEEAIQKIDFLRRSYKKKDIVTWCIIPAAGEGKRFGEKIPKQYVDLHGISILERSIDCILKIPKNSNLVTVIVILNKSDNLFENKLEDFVKSNKFNRVVAVKIGDETRQLSVMSGLKLIENSCDYDDWILVHDAARPNLSPQSLKTLWVEGSKSDVGAILATQVSETLKKQESNNKFSKNSIVVRETINRNDCWLAQTPQMFRYGILKNAIDSCKAVTDESSAIESLGLHPLIVKGDTRNIKVTSKNDYLTLKSLLMEPKSENLGVLRIGQGFDVHGFESGSYLILGGVKIDFAMGLKGHSDADVLVHSVCDGILGAACLGDIGQWFPDNDDSYKSIDSRILLRKIVSEIELINLNVYQIDCTVICEKPKILRYKDQMKKNLKYDTKCSYVNVKATTTEKYGFLGRGEAIAVLSNVSLKQKN